MDTFSIITTPSSTLLKKIHNTKERMPLVLPEEVREQWLSPELSEGEIKELMSPLPDGQLKAHTISRLITSRTQSTNVPVVCDEIEYPELKPQPALF